MIFSFLLIAIGLWSSYKIFFRFLQFFQQDEYNSSRFLPWWWRSRSFERTLSLSALVAGMGAVILNMAAPEWVDAWLLVAGGVVLVQGLLLKFPPSKKPLRCTARLQRVLAVAVFIQAAVLFGGAALTESMRELWPWVLLLHLQVIPLTIVLANLFLMPLEQTIQSYYLHQAHNRLQELQPKIVAITGSYGKTSTKHLIQQVLSVHHPVCMTPGSVNTLMGICRVIRCELRAFHKFLLAEMGAYTRGSIRKLCGLCPPDVAVVTGVGIAHLERFGSVEDVIAAKSELPQALSADGWFIYNADDPACRKMAQEVSCHKMSYGRHTDHGVPDLWVLSAMPTTQGTSLKIEYQGRAMSMILPIHGMHQVYNTAAALAVGITQNVSLAEGMASLSQVTPIPHRCVVRVVDGISWIDDCYNSNPVGFRNALEVLRTLPGQRSFLVTPGMVELGPRFDEEHQALVTEIMSSVDTVCLVAPHRLTALRKALETAGFPPERIHGFTHFSQARDWLTGQLRAGDKILLENDLPDLYEQSSAFSQ